MVPYGSPRRQRTKGQPHWYQTQDGKWHWDGGQNNQPEPTTGKPTDAAKPVNAHRAYEATQEARRERLKGLPSDERQERVQERVQRTQGRLQKNLGKGYRKDLLGNKGVRQLSRLGKKLNPLREDRDKLADQVKAIKTRLTDVHKTELDDATRTALETRLAALKTERSANREQMDPLREQRRELREPIAREKERQFARGFRRRTGEQPTDTNKPLGLGRRTTGVGSRADEARQMREMRNIGRNNRGTKPSPTGLRQDRETSGIPRGVIPTKPVDTVRESPVYREAARRKGKRLKSSKTVSFQPGSRT